MEWAPSGVRYRVSCWIGMAPGGVLALEMAPEQAPRLREAARERFAGAEITIMQDLGGRDRVLAVRAAHA